MEKSISLVLFALVTVGGSIGLSLVSGSGLWKSLGVGLFAAAMLALSFLGARYRAVDQAVRRFFDAYMRLTITLMVVAFLLGGSYWLSKLILEKLSGWLLVIALVVWGLVLTALLFLISTARRRERLFQRLRKVGGVGPAIYSGAVLLMAVNFFASVSYVLAGKGWIALARPSGKSLNPGIVSDFFLWHFLNAVPLLQINQTLHWTEPVTYQDAGAGWILFLFKLVVIIPVIASFTGYWRARHKEAALGTGLRMRAPRQRVHGYWRSSRRCK
jgi:hypothetical protein